MAVGDRGYFQHVPRDGVFLDSGGTDVAGRRSFHAHRPPQLISFLSVRLHHPQEQPTLSHHISTHPASATAQNA